MGRSTRGRRDTGRDPGGFVALPWTVLDSDAFIALSAPAKALLLEVARQHRGGDNGRLLLSRKHLGPRGWNSHDTIQRAKVELLDAGFIFETVKGARPNKASWYAVTWYALDKLPGYDSGAVVAFERGAYRKKAPPENAVLSPPRGTVHAPIVPPHGTVTRLPVPPHGAIRPLSGPLPVPPHGHPLDVAIYRTPGGEALLAYLEAQPYRFITKAQARPARVAECQP